MSEQHSQDTILDTEAVVSAYPAEMILARDKLVERLASLKETAEALDARRDLPKRVTWNVGANNIATLSFGDYSEDSGEALGQFRAGKEIAALAFAVEGVHIASNQYTCITFYPDAPDRVEATPDSPVLARPRVKIEWSSTTGDGQAYNVVSVYPNGYVEAGSSLTSITYVHPPATDEFTQKNAQPRATAETVLTPLDIQPAGLADIQNADFQIDQTLRECPLAL